MNPEEQMPLPEDPTGAVEADDTESVDDFIRELEAKEKDLLISADMEIEIEDSDFDDDEVTKFIMQDFVPPAPPARSPAQPHSPVVKSLNPELEKEIATLKARIQELKAERSDIQEKSDRRLKDFESFKYRADRERRGSMIDQIANLASQMLPVLDNLDRALKSAEQIVGQRSDDFQQFHHGIVLVNQQVNEVFANMGVEPIASVGEVFDPNFHEAVATDVCADVPANQISQEMLRGYRIGNRVIRHSMVKVTVKPPNASAPQPPTDPHHEELSSSEEV
jgi:molecular chaperone GrpE